jgi:uncharacterized membrane protein YjjP (DUF1212 family)
MTMERADTYQSLDLALTVGEIFLRSGAGAADVTATMLAVTGACGVRSVTADVTYTELALRHQPSPAEPAAIQLRRVTRQPVDYRLLTETDRAVHDLVDGRLTPDQARSEIAVLSSSGYQRRRWAITLGLGVMGSAVALRLGGTSVICALAFVAACAIDRTQLLLSRHRIPTFYQQTAGGLLATVIALVAAATSLDASPSRVVTSGIVILLAGIGLMGATQDAILGFPVTASARLLEAVLSTAGIVVGVSLGFALRVALGVELTRFQASTFELTRSGVMVLGAALAAAAFAYSSYAAMRAVAAVAIVAAISAAIAIALDGTSLGPTLGAGVAAIAIGLLSSPIANRISIPPLVIVVPAIVPLLPGLSIYKGLALLAEGKDGVPDLVTAALTALALAAGVLLGQFISQPIRREARALESRLSGPRLAGPRLGGNRQQKSPESDTH